jgi:hypothetical protein
MVGFGRELVRGSGRRIDMMGTMRGRAGWLVLVAIGVLAISACGVRSVSTGTRHADGVVAGRVTAGPTCPVERVGQPCPPRPVVTEVQARAASRIVASTRSAVDGTYRFDLPVGTYTLVAVTPNLYPRCVARTVTVVAARTTNGDITCDTGIR